MILQAIDKAGYKAGEQIWIALDAASTEFYDRSTQKYSIDGKQLSGDEMVDFLADWCDKYPICSIEDGCDEDDWETWKKLTESLATRSNWLATTCS